MDKVDGKLEQQTNLSWSQQQVHRFNKFCLVGVLGFLVDAAAFALLIHVSEAPFVSRVLAFWAAASATWLGNRRYTFATTNKQAALGQWFRHITMAHLSGMVNLSVFWACLWLTPLPVAFCAGVLAGLCGNYWLANRYVFTNPA